MKYRRLGKTNLRVSVIGMGTWQLGGEWGKTFAQAEVDRMFEAAREVHINLIDTAECYGDHESERFIGNAVAADRQQWVIATKFGHKFHGYMNRSDERSPADAVAQLEASLTALRTDYVDLLQYHSVRDSEFENDELTAALDGLLKAGKVRHLGNSIRGDTDSAMAQVQASTQQRVECVQVIYNRLDLRPEVAVFPSCIAQDLGVLARVPLASGLLSGKYKPGATFSANDFRNGQDREALDKRLKEVERIQQEELPASVKMAQWALGWCLSHAAVSAVIPGCKDDQQVYSNAEAAELAMVKIDHPQAWK
ncbi:MAG: aldo/keto reductase [Planctomycetota bacterium]|nr:aldo/keto reductase [Planctomycetota bacterium]